jgi:hypothetical protein
VLQHPPLSVEEGDELISPLQLPVDSRRLSVRGDEELRCRVACHDHALKNRPRIRCQWIAVVRGEKTG